MYLYLSIFPSATLDFKSEYSIQFFIPLNVYGVGFRCPAEGCQPPQETGLALALLVESFGVQSSLLSVFSTFYKSPLQLLYSTTHAETGVLVILRSTMRFLVFFHGHVFAETLPYLDKRGKDSSDPLKRSL